MNRTSGTVVIAGASLAGGTAAATLREEGFEGRIVLIGAEPLPPYERPPLSKEYLRGEAPFENALVKPHEFWRDASIDTMFGVAVRRIDPAGRRAVLSDGERIPYDKVLIATGGRNRRLRVPGADLEGIYDLRTAADADRIRAEIAPGRHAAVVGMGFIGAEVAASLRASGVEVTAVDIFSVPLQRALGEAVGRIVGEIHADHGVTMAFDDTVEAFEGSTRVERVRTKRGRVIGCDFVVVGVGIEPVTDAVREAGVALDDGILVDEFCRTNVDGIYAAGDVANHFHPLFRRHVRVEHWQNALRQGPAAARSMLGKATPYADVHWFWSDQYDHNIQYAGFHTQYDELVWRGDPAECKASAFYIQGGRVVACAGIDRGKDVRAAIRIIAAGGAVDRDLLGDDDVDLRKLIG